MTSNGLLNRLLLKPSGSSGQKTYRLTQWLTLALFPVAVTLSASPALQVTNEPESNPPIEDPQAAPLKQQTQLTAEEQTSVDTESLTQADEQLNPEAQTKQPQPWLFLHPYKASYSVSSSGDKLGSATRELSFKDGHWSLSMRSKISAYLLSLKSRENSRFDIEADQFLLQSFESSTKITFKSKRQVKQTFDWKNKIESGQRGSKKWQLPLSEPVYDRTSHILKLREDLINGKKQFSYLISYKGKRKHYNYEKQKQETITTGYGEYDTVKMVRISGDDSEFAIWLSPQLNYFPLRIAQYEQDKPDVVMNLSSLEFLPYQQPLAATH